MMQQEQTQPTDGQGGGEFNEFTNNIDPNIASADEKHHESATSVDTNPQQQQQDQQQQQQHSHHDDQHALHAVMQLAAAASQQQHQQQHQQYHQQQAHPHTIEERHPQHVEDQHHLGNHSSHPTANHVNSEMGKKGTKRSSAGQTPRGGKAQKPDGRIDTATAAAAAAAAAASMSNASSSSNNNNNNSHHDTSAPLNLPWNESNLPADFVETAYQDHMAEMAHSVHADESMVDDPNDSADNSPSKLGRQLSTSKRAAQNRAAQRAFRARREQYVKELESKAAQLEASLRTANECRGRYIDALQTIDGLRQDNHSLRVALAALGGHVAGPPPSSIKIDEHLVSLSALPSDPSSLSTATNTHVNGNGNGNGLPLKDSSAASPRAIHSSTSDQDSKHNNSHGHDGHSIAPSCTPITTAAPLSLADTEMTGVNHHHQQPPPSFSQLHGGEVVDDLDATRNPSLDSLSAVAAAAAAVTAASKLSCPPSPTPNPHSITATTAAAATTTVPSQS